MRLKKLLSLVLALAMVASLVISASADGPTNIVYTDFTDTVVDGIAVADTAADTLLSSYEGTQSGFATKFYNFNAAATVTAENGIMTFNNNATANKIAYKFNTPFTYDAEDPAKGIAMSYDLEILDYVSVFYTALGVHYTNTSGDAAVYANALRFDGPVDTSHDLTLVGNARASYYADYGEKLNVIMTIAPYNHFGAAQTTLCSLLAVNNCFTETSYSLSSTEVTGTQLVSSNRQTYKISNVKFYEVSTNPADIYFDTAAETDVAVDDNLEILVSQPILEKVLPNNVSSPSTDPSYEIANNLVVSKAGTPLTAGTDYTVSVGQKVVGNEVKGVITIDMTDTMDYGTTYTVSAAASKLITPYKVANNTAQTATFTTEEEPLPDIVLNSLTIVKDFNGTETVASGFTADGSLQVAKLNIRNTTSAPKAVAAIYAVYASGALVDMVYVNDTIAADTTTDLYAGVALAATGTVKTFVWDGISSMKPYADFSSTAVE